MNDPNYITFLISVAQRSGVVRYSVGIDVRDPLYQRIDIRRWAEPEMRGRLLSLLCDDWLSDDCSVVGCEQIGGSVQWQRVEA